MNKKTLIKRTALAIATSYTTLIGAGYAVYLLATGWSNKQKLAGRQASLEANTDIENEWFKHQEQSPWAIKTADGLTLRATFMSNAHNTNKVAILAHGLHHSREQMIPYARLFMDAGYSVLMPDARAHGRSDGNVIGFGWLDRNDYQQWIDTVIANQGEQVNIVLMGISMGATTVMATSGQTLPHNVRAIVEDSGFRNVFQEGKFRLWHKYHVPSSVLMPIADDFAKRQAGYAFKDGDILAEVAKNHLPILMFHGAKDQTVPVGDAYELYARANEPKQLIIDDEAAHISSIRTQPSKYRQTLTDFLNRYVK
ncbi:alpha/beta hydrolase [Furfurilactobacillus milii]|uniref:Alpha/beta fold hydrolase n=2 Tax=Furfurilactobacillus rossiae TaxID=231049 RepID=A0A7C9MU47_9LACO|nr:alpha/beta fold hydrolase [Furfurilactobacillus milii]MYV06168.1 alpha/beta fold hydrolase [Furfurilactobacillus milii]